jgi:hypothetical protein
VVAQDLVSAQCRVQKSHAESVSGQYAGSSQRVVKCHLYAGDGWVMGKGSIKNLRGVACLGLE